MELNYRKKNKICYYCEVNDILKFECYKTTENDIYELNLKNKGLIIPCPSLFKYTSYFPRIENKYLEWQLKKNLLVEYPINGFIND